jgi:sulfatase maturation enzyme AslB (radical SAM superfamily)
MYQHAEVVHWMKNPSKSIIPAAVDIDLTNICNQDCYYCNSAEFRKEKPVQKKYTDYIKLLDQLNTWREHSPNSYGTLHTITYPGGGEPTLLKGYEKVLEHTIDLGFMCSITTNGSNLDKLINNVHPDKIRKMGWIGVNVDAGTKDLYEHIRRSIPTESLFDDVMTNIKALTDMQANVDLKILLGEYNSNIDALHDIFKQAKNLNVRQIYFRPVLLNGELFPLIPLIPTLDELSKEYQVKAIYSTFKNTERTYKKCHQIFQFPVFCADGKIYVCCDHKGDPRFEIGSWDQGDFRDIWLSERHHKLYNDINVAFCPPCRPHQSNIKIQEILDNPALLENLYL